MRDLMPEGYYRIAAGCNYQEENKNQDRAWTGISENCPPRQGAYLAIIGRFLIGMMVERQNDREEQRQPGAEQPACRL